MPRKLALAMAYVPFQTWEKPYEDDTALCRGTAFPCLDKPFIGEEAVKNARTE
nr:spore coat associated protein CotJA [Ruminococcus sp.]